MSELQRHLSGSGGIPPDDFLAAVRRRLRRARLGPDAVLDDDTLDAAERELYKMALESPEKEIFR